MWIFVPEGTGTICPDDGSYNTWHKSKCLKKALVKEMSLYALTWRVVVQVHSNWSLTIMRLKRLRKHLNSKYNNHAITQAYLDVYRNSVPSSFAFCDLRPRGENKIVQLESFMQQTPPQGVLTMKLLSNVPLTPEL